MCTRCHGHSLYYQATVFALTFIVAMATVVIGDACSKYHGHTHYYQATMLINCLRLFVIVTMAMGFTLYSALSDLLHMILTTKEAGPRTFRSSPTTTCETLTKFCCLEGGTHYPFKENSWPHPHMDVRMRTGVFFEKKAPSI